MTAGGNGAPPGGPERGRSAVVRASLCVGAALGLLVGSVVNSALRGGSMLPVVVALLVAVTALGAALDAFDAFRAAFDAFKRKDVEDADEREDGDGGTK